MTYAGVLREMRVRLEEAGVEAASLEAREMLCFASGLTREQLYRDMALDVSPETCRRVREGMERRLAGEPVAYLIGEWDFYGLTLTVTPDVLIPRPDTELLVERALEAVRQRPPAPRVLDLCTGSGCVGLAVASRVPGCRVLLGDCSLRALAVCGSNIRRCHLDDRAETAVLDALDPPDPGLGHFDVLTCNPPYIPTGELAGLDLSVRGYEPLLALDGGADGLTFYRSILAHWIALLKPGGWLLLEIGIGQAGRVEEMLGRRGLSHIRITPDSGGIPRVAEGQKNFSRENE